MDVDVAADLAELRTLSTSCKRPRVKAMLDAYLLQLEAVIVASKSTTVAATDVKSMDVDPAAAAPPCAHSVCVQPAAADAAGFAASYTAA